MISPEFKKTVRPLKIIRPSYRNLIIVFSFLAIILVILILYFALSQASIFVIPKYSEQQVGFVVQVVNQTSPQANSPQPQRINGLLLESTQETQQQFPAREVETIQSKATGQLTVYNDYSQAQPLISRTRFESPQGLIFRLISGVTVPAKGNLEVKVEADQTGDQYEIGSTKFILPALSEWRRQYVYAESFEPMTREHSTQFLIDQQAIDQAKAELENQLILKAKEELADNLKKGQIILDDSLKTEVIKYSISEEPGSKQANFTISLAVAIKALIINQEELYQQAIESLPSSYTQNGSLTKINNNSFTYEVIYLDENSENLLAQIKGEFLLAVAMIEIDKNNLKGLTKKEAETYLNNLSGVKEAVVRLPFWTKYLPTLEDNINIEVKK